MLKTTRHRHTYTPHVYTRKAVEEGWPMSSGLHPSPHVFLSSSPKRLLSLCHLVFLPHPWTFSFGGEDLFSKSSQPSDANVIFDHGLYIVVLGPLGISLSSLSTP